MGRIDFKRFNGYALKRLDDQLWTDFLNFDIFNERDMHSSAYYYIRDYFRKRKHERDAVYVRCESWLAGMRPDIVVYERGNPIYVLEFKFFSTPNYISEKKVYDDLYKLAKCVKSYDSVRWGFFFMIYDADDPFTFSRSRLRRAGFGKLSVMPINARRFEKTGRRRKGYDEWRTEYDGLHRLHSEHARAKQRPNRG